MFKLEVLSRDRAFAIVAVAAVGGCAGTPTGDATPTLPASDQAQDLAATDNEPQRRDEPGDVVGNSSPALVSPTLDVQGVASRTGATTPSGLSILLHQDVDHLVIQSVVRDPMAGDSEATTCQTHEVFRIGPDAVNWPLETSREFPLAYPETLSNGPYIERLKILVHSGQEAVLEPQRYFEVSDNAVASLSSEVFQERVALPVVPPPGGGLAIEGGGYGEYPHDPARLCPELAQYTDETSAEHAVTTVNLGNWDDTSTIQPLRVRETGFGDAGPSVHYWAQSDSGGRLAFTARHLADSPAPELSFEANDARLEITEAGTTSSWHAVAGHARVTATGDTRLQVEFFDLELVRLVGEQRFIEQATILGEIRRECALPGTPVSFGSCSD